MSEFRGKSPLWIALLVGIVFVLPAPAHARYGAVAVARTAWGYCTGGSNNFPSQAIADERALYSCSTGGSGCTNCRIQTRFSGPGTCGYRTQGHGPGAHCLGVGRTAAEAYRLCVAKGCACDPPLGGCNR